MNDNITELLDLCDEDCVIIDVKVEGATKHITLEKRLQSMICPVCGARMYSKGKFTRHPKHQVLQDGYTLEIEAIGRRWECSNPDCSTSCRDHFAFIPDHKQIPVLIQLQILNDLKDLNLTCRQVAQKYHVSDSFVHDVFTKYVDLPRMPLTSVICIDEVYLNFRNDCLYAMIIMDLFTGEILDIVPSRREHFTRQWFNAIPRDEKDRVRYLITDMYNPYLAFTDRYFPNAVSVVDSFHVMKYLNAGITDYINIVKRRYRERDRRKFEAEHHDKDLPLSAQLPISKEVYILDHARWVLLRSSKNFHYAEKKYNRELNRYLDSYDWINAFLGLDDHFPDIQFYRQYYEEFNDNYAGDKEGARKALPELIRLYEASDLPFIRSFAALLKKYFDPIIESFTLVEAEDGSMRRLSNGPMESFNNKPSHLRSQSHGVKNFYFVRNRILWATRKHPAIKANPRSDEEVHAFRGRKRGPYRKKR